MKRSPPYTVAHISVLRSKVGTIQSIAPPIKDSCGLSTEQWDQLSALLTDYLSFSHMHLQMLESCNALRALELVNKWRSQAADLRDIIENRD